MFVARTLSFSSSASDGAVLLHRDKTQNLNYGLLLQLVQLRWGTWQLHFVGLYLDRTLESFPWCMAFQVWSQFQLVNQIEVWHPRGQMVAVRRPDPRRIHRAHALLYRTAACHIFRYFKGSGAWSEQICSYVSYLLLLAARILENARSLADVQRTYPDFRLARVRS